MNLVVWTGTSVLEEMTVERQVLELGQRVKDAASRFTYNARMINKMMSHLAYENADLTAELNALRAQLGMEEMAGAENTIEERSADEHALIETDDRQELSAAQRRQIDFYYRRIARMCHPDRARNLPELHDALTVAKQLRDAGDVASLQAIYESVKSYVADLNKPGGWLRGLNRRKTNLQNNLRQLLNQLDEQERSLEYQIAMRYSSDHATATEEWRAVMRQQINAMRNTVQQQRSSWFRTRWA